ncbi:hypothetical protein, partial [Cellulomonas alba]
SFNNERGEAVAYDYFELRVLSPEADLSVLRVPADNSGRPAVPLPDQGDEIRARVEFRSAGGNVKATALAIQVAATV